MNYAAGNNTPRTDGVDRGGRRGRISAGWMLGSAVVIAAVSGCSITVPADTTNSTAPSVSVTSYAPPTVVAGHDAKAVAAANMTFAAGNSLSPGVAVEFSDSLGQELRDAEGAPMPPDWTAVSALATGKAGDLAVGQARAGQTQYRNQAGCQLAYWVTSNQGPLIVQDDDEASTRALLKYLIPSVTNSALTESTLPWSAETAAAAGNAAGPGAAGKSSPTISFLSFHTKAGKDVMASTVWARILGTAGTGLVVTLACSSDELLTATTPKLMANLSVAPPSS